MFDTRAVLQQPIFIALLVEPKARLLVLYGLGCCRWGTYAVHDARESRGGGQKARWHALQRSGCSGLSARVGVSVGLVSSALWDRLTATRRSALLVVLRLGAGGTTTGRGLAVARLVAVCWSPHDDDTIDRILPPLFWM